MSTKNPLSKHQKQGQNLRQAIKALGIPAIEVADNIGVSRSLISGLITGKKSLQKYHLLLFESILRIISEFIQSGKEPILLSEQKKAKPPLSEKSVRNSSELYEKLVQAKDMIIEKQEGQIESFNHDKKRLQNRVDMLLEEIEKLKRENADLEKGKTSA